MPRDIQLTRRIRGERVLSKLTTCLSHPWDSGLLAISLARQIKVHKCIYVSYVVNHVNHIKE
jgi:hypothetical protein